MNVNAVVYHADKKGGVENCAYLFFFKLLAMKLLK